MSKLKVWAFATSTMFLTILFILTIAWGFRTGQSTIVRSCNGLGFFTVGERIFLCHERNPKNIESPASY